MSMRRKLIGIAIAAALIGLPLALKALRGEDAKPMEIERVAARELKASILASGNLVFREQAQLSPEVIGKVTALLVKEGDKVEKGQAVLRLDEEFYRAEVASQEAVQRQQRINIERQELNLANEERQFQRSQTLHKRQLLDDNQFDAARHALDLARVELRASREALQQAEATLQQSRERLARTEIRSPIAGTVTAVDIKLGETAVASSTGIAGSSLMTIADTESIMAEANVDEADIARIALDQEVSVYAVAFADTPLKGRVESIPLSPKRAEGMQAQGSGSPLARSYAVKVRLDEPAKLQLRPGMTCRVEIYTATAGRALAVPIQAVFTEEELDAAPQTKKAKDTAENYVFVDKDGKAEKRVVKIGLSDDSHQEILAGLKAGDSIVVGPYKQLRHLRAGDKLSHATPDAAKAGPAQP